MEKLWTRCEESIPRPFYLAPDSTCSFYLLEYVSGGSYQQYPNNSRIFNFKIPVEFRHEQRWRYKQEAIQYFAARIMECIKLPQLDAILVSMPTSKPRNDHEFDSRLDDVVRIIHNKTGQRIGFNLDTIHSSEAFHSSGSSRYISDISGNINFTSFEPPVPARVLLIDDVVTTGSHFIACSDKIKQCHPDTFIFGLFLAKRYGRVPRKMNKIILQEMLDEIDSMTSEEYWELFNESQKLPDFLLDGEPVPVMAVIDHTKA